MNIFYSCCGFFTNLYDKLYKKDKIDESIKILIYDILLKEKLKNEKNCYDYDCEGESNSDLIIKIKKLLNIMKYEMKKELRKEIKDDLRYSDVVEELLNEIKDELRIDTREAIMNELREEMRYELMDDLLEDVKEEIWNDVKIYMKNRK